jgi:hypothetical protein
MPRLCLVKLIIDLLLGLPKHIYWEKVDIYPCCANLGDYTNKTIYPAPDAVSRCHDDPISTVDLRDTTMCDAKLHALRLHRRHHHTSSALLSISIHSHFSLRPWPMIENVRLEVSIYLATISDVALMLAKDASSYLHSDICI